METFVFRKENGSQLMKSGQYNESIDEFTYVIDNIAGRDEDCLYMISICLLNRSSCYLFQENANKSIEDAEKLIKIINELDSEVSNSNRITAALGLAYIRLGEAYEYLNDFLLSIRNYLHSIAIIPSGGGKEAISRIKIQLGLSEEDYKDEKLKLFNDIKNKIEDESIITNCLSSLYQEIEDNILDEERLSLYISNHVHIVLYAIIHVYLSNEIIVNICIVIIRNYASKGFRDIFDGLPVIKNVYEKWEKNQSIVGDLIRLLHITPDDMYQDLIEYEFSYHILSSFKLGLSVEEADFAFLILFHLLKTPSMIAEAENYCILDFITKYKTKSSIILLSRMCSVDEICEIAYRKNILEYTFTILSKVTEEHMVIIPTIITIARIVLRLPNGIVEKSKDIVGHIMPVVLKHSRIHDIISNGFAILSVCTELNPNAIIESRAIQASSILLAMNITEVRVVQSILAFLVSCSRNGLSENINQLPTLLTTVLTAFSQNISNLEIVERSVLLVVNCSHPKSNEFLMLGMKMYPSSKPLKSIYSRLQKK